MDAVAQPRTTAVSPIASTAVWGPGPLVMLADTDAGNVVTTAQAGAQWSYRPLLVLAPMLYRVQELTVRLGLHIGRGYGELIRERFGVGWAWLSTMGLAAAVIASLVTEFSGVAGVGELCGLSRGLTLPLAAATLLAAVATGSYRRVERAAIVIGLFELAFFAVAWAAHPSSKSSRTLEILAKEALNLPLSNREFIYMVAAVIGSVFNPWMIFYQQFAIADKRLQLDHLNAARWDTAFSAVLTQCLTGACWSPQQRRSLPLARRRAWKASARSAARCRRVSGKILDAWCSAPACSALLWWPPSSARWPWPGG